MERATLILRDGRRCGAKRFYIAGDFNIELGLLCAGNEEDEELCGMYGPLCWQGYGTDTGGFKKMLWYNIIKEYHCKAISMWLSLDERKDMAFTHKQWGKNGRTSQLDCILGSKADSGVTYILQWCHALQYVGSLSSVRRDIERRRRTMLRKKKRKGVGRIGSRAMRWRELNAERRWCTQKKAFEKIVWRQSRRKPRTRRKRFLTPQSWKREWEERAVARSLRPDERRVLRRQARKARAANLVKCSLALGERRVLRKALMELHINGVFFHEKSSNICQ